MQASLQTSPDSSKCVFYPGVFNETLAMLFEAHSYFQERGLEEQASLASHHRLLYANEMSRITLRLTSIMAWLMVRKAIFAGRLAEEDSLARYQLEARDECLTYDAAFLDQMPYYIGYLAERSFVLYQRVLRLETMLEQERRSGMSAYQ
jgi:hypothetical protein